MMTRKAEMKYVEELKQEVSSLKRRKVDLAQKIALLQQRLTPTEQAIYTYANMEQDYNMLKTHRVTLDRDMASLDWELNVLEIAIDVYAHAHRDEMSDKKIQEVSSSN